MLIRPAAAADIAAVARLVGHYWEFEGIGDFQAPRIEALLNELLGSPQRGALWIAQAGTSISGYLLAVYGFSLEHGGLIAEIDEVFVTPSTRSAGIGSSLLAAAEQHLAMRGVVRVQLQLGVGNERARQFYQRRGFAGRVGYELLDKPL